MNIARIPLSMILCVSFAASMPSKADEYPSKPIRLIVPTGPGAASDIRARQIAPKITEATKQPVVVENRPGASGTIAAEAVARAQADGYTALLGSQGELIVYPTLGGTVRYDPVRDFAPVAILTYGYGLMLVNAATGIKSIGDLVARAKAAPDELTCGTPGQGTPEHLACAWFAQRAGIKVRNISYKSPGAAALGAASGEVHLLISYPVAVEKQYVLPGKLFPLAALSPTRFPTFPNTPTIAEAGFPEHEFPAWTGVFLPAGVSGEIISRLNSDAIMAMRDPTNAEAVRLVGGVSPSWSPAQVSEFLQKERARWKRAADETGIRIDQ